MRHYRSHCSSCHNVILFYAYHHTSSHNITQHHTTSHNITQHHTISHNIRQPHTTSNNITQYHTTIYNITQHNTKSYNIIKHHRLIWMHCMSLCLCPLFGINYSIRLICVSFWNKKGMKACRWGGACILANSDRQLTRTDRQTHITVSREAAPLKEVLYTLIYTKNLTCRKHPYEIRVLQKFWNRP